MNDAAPFEVWTKRRFIVPRGVLVYTTNVLRGSVEFSPEDKEALIEGIDAIVNGPWIDEKTVPKTETTYTPPGPPTRDELKNAFDVIVRAVKLSLAGEPDE